MSKKQLEKHPLIYFLVVNVYKTLFHFPFIKAIINTTACPNHETSKNAGYPLTNAGLMFCQRRRRWAYIKPALVGRLVFAGRRPDIFYCAHSNRLFGHLQSTKSLTQLPHIIIVVCVEIGAKRRLSRFLNRRQVYQSPC